LIEDDLSGGPIRFQIPGNPQLALGSEATLLIGICERYLTAEGWKEYDCVYDGGGLPFGGCINTPCRHSFPRGAAPDQNVRTSWEQSEARAGSLCCGARRARDRSLALRLASDRLPFLLVKKAQSVQVWRTDLQ
jgi:hypothetical protein